MSARDNREQLILGRPRSEAEAQIWVDVLKDENIDAAYFPDRQSGVFGAGADLLGSYPVMVEATEMERAQQVIRELGGEAELVEHPRTTEEMPQRRRLAASGMLALVAIPAIMVTAAVVSWLLG